MTITRIADFGYNITATSANTTGALAISAAAGTPAALPIGTLAVVAFTGISATAPSNITLTDSGGNTWSRSTLHRGTVGAINEDTAVWASKLTTGLTTSSTFTISSTGGANWTKQAVAVCGFSDAVNGSITYGGWSENPSQVPITIPSTTTPSTSGQTWFLFGAYAVINSGRGYIAATGWSAGTKYISNTGGGDRGIVICYREAAASQTYTTFGSNSSSVGSGTTASGITVAGGVGYINQGAGAPPVEPGYVAGTAYVRTAGGTWTPATAKVRSAAGGGTWVDATIKVRTT